MKIITTLAAAAVSIALTTTASFAADDASGVWQTEADSDGNSLLIYIGINQKDVYSSTPRFDGIVIGALDKHGREIQTEHEGIKVLRDVRFEWLDWMDAGDGELGHVYDLDKDKEYLSGDGNSLNLREKTLTVETCGWWCSSQTWTRVRKGLF